MISVNEMVRDYYGKVLQTNKDLKTTSCCSTESIPNYLKEIVASVHPKVQEKFYGCGVPIPHSLDGLTVLDLGCGSGRDCFVLSKLVGETGKVIGVDMTEEQLSVAKEYQDYHRQKYGYKKSNISFLQGFIEDLKALDIPDNSVDLVVSNCVFNLSPLKQNLYQEMFRVLKPGGELYFSDVFVDRRLRPEQVSDPILLGECLGGAQYTEDFRRMMQSGLCQDFRVISSTPIEMTNPEVAHKVGLAKFTSITIRAFKIDLEDRCEDYGQVATYKGGIFGAENAFMLDDHHLFELKKPMLVCSNTANMLSQTRFSSYFDIQGDTKNHFGLFDCAPTNSSPASSNSAPCC